MAEYAISRAEEGVTSHNEKPTSTTKTVADTNTPQTLEIVGFVGTADDLPRNYYWSSYFLGTFFAISMSFLSGNGGFAYIAPVLGLVNADLGPSENIIWVAIVYTLSLAAGMLMVGRLTDLFGRRWFFIGGGLLGIVGSIVCARAQNVNTLIGGEVLIGLGASTGVSYPFVVGELVPVKYRFAACGLVYVIMYGNGFGAAISTAFILYTSPGWRWCYYLLVITNSLATASFFAFYHPPTFRMKYERTSRMQIIKNFDYVGTVLFLAGLIMFLLGLNWGGQQYAWKSAQVVCTLVLGLACMVAFGVWEAMARLKEPLLPAHLFNNVPWVASVLLLSLGASVYYAFNVVWASMVQMVYAHPDDPMWAGWVMSLIGLVIGTGEIVGGLLAEKIGKVKYQCMFMITVASVCLASESDTLFSINNNRILTESFSRCRRLHARHPRRRHRPRMHRLLHHRLERGHRPHTLHHLHPRPARDRRRRRFRRVSAVCRRRRRPDRLRSRAQSSPATYDSGPHRPRRRRGRLARDLRCQIHHGPDERKRHGNVHDQGLQRDHRGRGSASVQIRQYRCLQDGVSDLDRVWGYGYLAYLLRAERGSSDDHGCDCDAA